MAEDYSIDLYRLSEDEENKKTHTIVCARFSDNQPSSKRLLDYFNIAMVSFIQCTSANSARIGRKTVREASASWHYHLKIKSRVQAFVRNHRR